MAGHSSEALSVSAVAKFIYNLISQNIAPLWIKGEVSNLKVQANGNVYFSIKDSDSKLNALVMAHSKAKRSVPDLKDGLEVILLGNVSYYKKEGTITVFVEEIELLGEGVLKRKFDALKEKLQKEGLFDKSKKKPIPEFPKWVGVITSPSGAAIRDILNVTKRRFSGVNLILFGVAVQGENAAFEISSAIRIANHYARDFIDVLIVGRGGGALEDLWCFNEEAVARAIAESEIPVISAVGHEIDYTIADYVADLRAPTPSAAAEMVVKDRSEVLQYIANLKNRLNMLVQSRLEKYRYFLQAKGKPTLKKMIQNQIAENRLTLQNLQNRLDNYYTNNIQQLKNQITLQKEKLIALNPEKILERGYSITYQFDEDGRKRSVLSAEAVKNGETILTKLFSGEIVSVAKRKE